MLNLNNYILWRVIFLFYNGFLFLLWNALLLFEQHLLMFWEHKIIELNDRIDFLKGKMLFVFHISPCPSPSITMGHFFLLLLIFPPHLSLSHSRLGTSPSKLLVNSGYGFSSLGWDGKETTTMLQGVLLTKLCPPTLGISLDFCRW